MIRVRTPWGRAVAGTTQVHMTVLATRPSRHRRSGRRFLRDEPAPQDLRERVRRGEYEVDPDAVAAAILRRLAAGRQCS